MLKQGKNHSPGAKRSGHETSLRQKGMSSSAPSAVEPKPKGGGVDASPTRSDAGTMPPTIGPRVA